MPTRLDLPHSEGGRNYNEDIHPKRGVALGGLSRVWVGKCLVTSNWCLVFTKVAESVPFKFEVESKLGQVHNVSL